MMNSVLVAAPCVLLLVLLGWSAHIFLQWRNATNDDAVASADVDIHNDLQTWERAAYFQRVSAKRKRLLIRWVLVSGVIVLVGLALTGGGSALLANVMPSPTPTLTPTGTPTSTPTVTHTPTIIPTRTAPPIIFVTPTLSVSSTATPTSTVAVTATARVVYIQITVIVTRLVDRMITNTPGPTRTPKPTRTRLPTRTRTPTESPTATYTFTPTIIFTPTGTQTETPTPTIGVTP